MSHGGGHDGGSSENRPHYHIASSHIRYTVIISETQLTGQHWPAVCVCLLVPWFSVEAGRCDQLDVYDCFLSTADGKDVLNDHFKLLKRSDFVEVWYSSQMKPLVFCFDEVKNRHLVWVNVLDYYFNSHDKVPTRNSLWCRRWHDSTLILDKLRVCDS